MKLLEYLFGKSEKGTDKVLVEMIKECGEGGLRFRRSFLQNNYCMILEDNNKINCPYRAKEVKIVGNTYLYPCLKK